MNEGADNKPYSLQDLQYLMARLRDPQTGCPWDLKQTNQTVAPHTLEEVHEVLDAIEREDHQDLRDELGDLLFQVVFYAQLAQEARQFDLTAVVDGIVRKLLRRHPHVFPDGTLHSQRSPSVAPDDAQIKQNWERIKAEERALKAAIRPAASAAPAPSVLHGIARSLPAMARAEKLQRRAAQYGFDWPDITPVFAKFEEELAELKVAWQGVQAGTDTREHLEEELGDLLFVCVNMARFLDTRAENALNRTNDKFERRFRAIEAILAVKGVTLESQRLETLDDLWNQVKAQEQELC